MTNTQSGLINMMSIGVWMIHNVMITYFNTFKLVEHWMNQIVQSGIEHLVIVMVSLRELTVNSCFDVLFGVSL